MNFSSKFNVMPIRKTNPLLKNHPIRKDHAIYERDIRDLENMFGKEVADYYRARVNVRS